jgi:catechol 2,3-dioxygenase-like lactoylglutathione lyase family enzyme
MAEYAVPTLPSRDLRATLAFYERLGFANAGDPPEQWGYLIVRRGPIELHFYGDDAAPAGRCFAWVDDVDALHAAVGADGAPEDTPFGVRMFSVTDPTGNEIAFGTGPH